MGFLILEVEELILKYDIILVSKKHMNKLIYLNLISKGYNMKNRNNRSRRVLEDSYVDSNRNQRYRDEDRYDYDEYGDYEEVNYSDDYYGPYPRKKAKKNKVFYLNLIVSFIFLSFIWIFGLFYSPTRLLITIIYLSLLLISVFISLSKKAVFAKVISCILMLVNIAFVISFISLYLYADASIKTTNIDNVAANPNIYNDHSYNLYISGFDNEGSINTVSRSDVNILTTVNMKDKKVLLTTIPRDTYLPIALGGKDQYDKLTHAGIYGVASSMKTIENALNTPVEYYFKINFTSFIDIVDVVGGIDIDNEYEFTAWNGVHFPKGKLHLDGDQALSYVRERKSLAEGDIGRGKHQQQVMMAIADEIASPKNLFRYPKIIRMLKKSIATNVPTRVLFNTAFEYGKSSKFEIEREYVQGYGQKGLPSFAMPNYRLYMYVPYKESLENISNNIRNLLNN